MGVAHEWLMHVGVGTSMALVIPTAVAATWRQHRNGNLDLGFYRSWALGLLAGSAIGVALLPFCSTEALKGIFIVYLLVVGTYEGFVKESMHIGQGGPRGGAKLSIAAVIGAASTLTGTAGGAFTTPALTAFGVPLRRALATASATGLVTGVIGTAGAIVSGWNVVHLSVPSLGYVDGAAWAAMTPGIMLGAPLGVRAAAGLRKDSLKRTFSLLLFCIAADMALRMLG
jgi:uncharacterized membrane protein YfcA